MNMEYKSDLRDFFVEKAILDGVDIGEDTITFKYLQMPPLLQDTSEPRPRPEGDPQSR